jgi:hypothetical protein
MSKIIEGLLELFLIVIFAIMSFLALPTLITISILSPSFVENLVPASVRLKPGLMRSGSWVVAVLVVGIFCTAGFQSTTVVSLVAGIGVALGILPADSFQTL